MLKNPKYAGRHVWGRSSSKLRSRARSTPPEQWVVTPGAFEPIVDEQTFETAQLVHLSRSFPPMSDEEMLDRLAIDRMTALRLFTFFLGSTSALNTAFEGSSIHCYSKESGLPVCPNCPPHYCRREPNNGD